MTISMLLLPAGAVSISLGWTVTAHHITTGCGGVLRHVKTDKHECNTLIVLIVSMRPYQLKAVCIMPRTVP